MWHQISTDSDILAFMHTVSYFHDSCIKEMKYLSGAYVDKDLSMHPVNDRRILRLLIQRQFEDPSMIEMEFEGLKYLRLFPVDDTYSCEIMNSSLMLKKGLVYWCDCGGISGAELDNYDGTILCAEKLRWRSVCNCLGQKEFYTSPV